MEFLQRHFPRVHQAVQDALDFFTNVTAQIFGAPPNAPQPRNARTNVPIQTPKESPAEGETGAKQEASTTTQGTTIFGTTDENEKSSSSLQEDEDNGRRETDLRHRKSDSGGRRDLEYKITENVDIVLHTSQVTTYSYEIENTDPQNITITHEVFSQEEVQVSLKSGNPELGEDIVCHHEEELKNEYLEANDPLKKVSKDGEHSSDGQYGESQSITVKGLSLAVEEEPVITPGQEHLDKDLQTMCLIEITESEAYDINSEQVAEAKDSTVTMAYEVENILDVIEINKKLVTPVGDSDRSPNTQGRRKTLEDLLETANRLAKHCDLSQNGEDQTGSEDLGNGSETPGPIPVSEDHMHAEEDLTSMDVSSEKNTFVMEIKESLEEETIQVESLVHEQSTNIEEDEDVSTKDIDLPREDTTKPEIEGKEEPPSETLEEPKSKDSESQSNISKNQRPKKRVHFSPSTEDLFKKSEETSTNRLQRVCDDILEDELQHSIEDPKELGISFTVTDIGQSPKMEEECLESTTFSHDNGQSTNEEEQMNMMVEGQTTWYEDYQEHNERCESLEDATHQNVKVDFKIRQSFVAKTEEDLDLVLQREEMPFTESDGSVDSSKGENVKSDQMENKKQLFQETEDFTASSDEAEEMDRKEDSFLQEETRQVDNLTEERTEVLQYDANDSVHDISQWSDSLDTKGDGLSEDLTEEQKHPENLLSEQAIPAENYPAEDADNDQLKLTQDHKDVTEMESSAEYKAEKELENLKGEQSQSENQDLFFSPEEVLKSLEEQAEEEDTLQGQPVSIDLEEYSKNLYKIQLTTSMDDISVSLVEDVEFKEGLPTEEDKDLFKDEMFPEEGEPLKEISTYTDTRYGQPVSIDSEESSEILHETQLTTSIDNISVSLVEDVEFKEGLPSEEDKDLFRDKIFPEEGETLMETSTFTDTRYGQPVSIDREESSENLYETQLTTSTDDICVSLVEDVGLKEGQPSEEDKDLFRDETFAKIGEALKEISTYEMEEQQHKTGKQDYDHKHEGFPLETSDSQEEDLKVKDCQTNVELSTDKQCEVEEQGGVEASQTEDNDQRLEDKIIGQQVSEDEETPEESNVTGQSTSPNEPFHSTLDVSAQKSRVLLLRKSSVRRRPSQRPVTVHGELTDPSPPEVPSLDTGYPAEEPADPTFLRKPSFRRRQGQRPVTIQGELTDPSPPEIPYPAEEPADPTFLRKPSIRRRQGQRPVTFQGDMADPEEATIPEPSSAKSSHPTEEPMESTTSEQSSIHQYHGQRPATYEDEANEPPPVIGPLRMGFPVFPGGTSMSSQTVVPALHPAEEPMGEGSTSEPILRRKSSVRRKGRQPVTSEEQPPQPPPPGFAPLKTGIPEVPTHVTPTPHPGEEPQQEPTPSEELAIKPKKGFLKHSGFGGAHPGMMQELQARLHKKKPKE